MMHLSKDTSTKNIETEDYVVGLLFKAVGEVEAKKAPGIRSY